MTYSEHIQDKAFLTRTETEMILQQHGFTLAEMCNDLASAFMPADILALAGQWQSSTVLEWLGY